MARTVTCPPAKTNSEALLAEGEDDGTTLSPPDLPVAASARRGVTLIEAVLFISVALGLIVGGLVFYQQASLAARTQELIRLTNSIVAEARVIYGRNRAKGVPLLTSPFAAFCGDLCKEIDEWWSLRNLPFDQDRVFIAAGSIPPSNLHTVSGTPQIVSQWGQVGIGLARLQGTTNLMLRLQNIPSEVCARITTVSTDGGSVLGGGVYLTSYVSINTHYFTPKAPLPPNVTAEMCSTEGYDGTIIIGFKLD